MDNLFFMFNNEDIQFYTAKIFHGILFERKLFYMFNICIV